MTEIAHDLSRMPPHAPDIEQAVLGAMMLSGAAIDQVRQAIPEDAQDFWYDGAHAIICDAVFALQDRGDPVDQITLTEEIKRQDMLDRVGGVVYLAQLMSEVATTANVEFHMLSLKDYYLQRRMITLSSTWIEQGYDPTSQPAELVAQADESLRTLLQSCQRDTAFTGMEEAMAEYMEYQDGLVSNKLSLTGIPSGFVEMDKATAGWQRSDMITLAARPSVGKTALALALARNAASAGHGVLFFSLEMARVQLMTRLVCAECRIESMRARRGFINPEESERMADHANSMSQWPMHFNDEAGLSIAEIRAMARSKKRQIETLSGGDRTLDMVIIDYLQLVHAGVRTQNREQEVAHVSREIKAMAKDLNVPVLALSQLNRSVESRPDRKPQLSDLRDSGEVEQNSDLVLFLYRPEIYNIKGLDGEDLKGLAQVIIGKHRNGPTDTVDLNFTTAFGTFEDRPIEYTPNDQYPPY